MMVHCVAFSIRGAWFGKHAIASGIQGVLVFSWDFSIAWRSHSAACTFVQHKDFSIATVP
jgi:hypothetical protein